MRSMTQMLMALGLVLATTVIAHAQIGEMGAPRWQKLSPTGCNCARGPVFEKVRLDPSEETGQPGDLKFTQGASLDGQILSTIDMVYRDQPPSVQTYPTQSGFPPEIVYMAVPFQPSNRGAWVRIDFSALVSVSPPVGNVAGLGYALYLKEDGGDGTIANPGVMACGGDDTCGYLEQTYNVPWLVATDSNEVWASVGRVDYFKAYGTRRYEVQVHVFPIHDGAVAGSVAVNNGTMMISTGKP